MMPQSMLTPKQLLNLRASIKEHGLNEELFQLDITSKQVCLTHHETKYYFLFSAHPPPPVSIANRISEKLLDFHIKFTPSKLKPHLSADDFSRFGAESWERAVDLHLNRWLFWLKEHYGPFEAPRLLDTNEFNKDTATSLAHLHPTVQQVASSRFASGHYSDAIQKACTALEKAVQVKSGQPRTATGTSVMTTAFSKNNTLIHLADDPTEQFGFMNLYQGAVQALRNHFAHGLTELTDTARALEWLAFISALFYKLDEAQPPTA